MKRIVYTTKGNTRELKQIEDGLAIKLGGRNHAAHLGSHPMSGRNEWISHKDIHAFCQAGWIFLEPDSQLMNFITQGWIPDGIEDAGKIYLDSNNQLKIATDEISIHFDPFMSYNKCLKRIRDFDLQLVTVLPYGKNLFTVRSNSKINALEKCIDINRHRDVRYAEPNFIQLIPGSSYLQD